MPATRPGPSADRGVVKATILEAARWEIAERGFAGSTLRSVADRAGVDPRLVAYYFGDKAGLLEACTVPPPEYFAQMAAIFARPLRGRGKQMMQAFVGFWSSPTAAPVFRVLVLSAVHEPVAYERLMVVYRNNFVAAIDPALDEDQRGRYAGLAASFVLGVFMTRYVYRVEPIASLGDDDLVTVTAPILQRLLTGRA